MRRVCFTVFLSIVLSPFYGVFKGRGPFCVHTRKRCGWGLRRRNPMLVILMDILFLLKSTLSTSASRTWAAIPVRMKSANLALFSASSKYSAKVSKWHFAAYLVSCQVGNLPTFRITFGSSGQNVHLILFCVFGTFQNWERALSNITIIGISSFISTQA